MGIVVAGALVLIGAPAASAHSFSSTCADDLALDIEVAMCERLDALAAHQHDGSNITITGVNIPPGAFDPRPAGALQVFDASLYAATERNAINDDDVQLKLQPAVTDSLSLTWAGVWVGCGVLLVLLFAPLFHRVFNFWR